MADRTMVRDWCLYWMDGMSFLINYENNHFPWYKGELTCSAIIVTSLPSCSDYILEVVEFTHYQTLGSSPWTVEMYIKEYFKDNSTSLLDILKVCTYLRQHFYIPFTVVIMCFVYHRSDNQLPKNSVKSLWEICTAVCSPSRTLEVCWTYQIT